ncbi:MULTISPECIES: MarR family transcriptional regulator [Streptomyces]|jgi:biotin operon repressor|uniref:MarR family transcriptional regulator n=1 Tax=Streptomyces chilikensis TaxID=1194079 RepID=A0ABV3EUI0_9ACTN|nr:MULTISPECIES: MarR family transcriptional regulator [Streptomyces]MDH6229416.1 biotin operon repressor [Streptomyces sp. MJP52]
MAQPQRDDDRSPRSSPAPDSPYNLAPRPRDNLVRLPAGHSAEVRPPVSAGNFIGGYFAQDSLEFLCWMAQYFRDDNTSLRVLLWLMGSQDVGGAVCLKQREIADALQLTRPQVSRSIHKLENLGLVFSPRRGHYQLQPAVTLRGGYRAVPKPGRGSGRRVTVPVEQLSLLSDLALDPNVPDEFRALGLPGARLPEKPKEA